MRFRQINLLFCYSEKSHFIIRTSNMFKHQTISVVFSVVLMVSIAAPVGNAAWRKPEVVPTVEVADGAVAGVNWPSFLGRGGTMPDPKRVPTQWSPEKNIAWKTKLTGAGQSSPVVWGDRVFVTSIEGAMKDTCIVSAVSLTDGRILWTHQSPASQPVRSNYYQSRAAPTPVVDADGVYAFFETGNFVALSHDGQERWSRSLVDDFGEFEVRIGLSASLAQTDDYVMVLVDHEGPSYLLAIDKSTGDDGWKTERFSRQSYSSPIVLPVGDQLQVVVSSAGSVDGYDPQTGEMLWTYEEVGGNRSTTPLPVTGNRFLIAASPGMHDEYISDARKSNLVMEIQFDGESHTPKVVWRTSKAMPSFGSPMVHQGLAYWVTKIGIVFCFDADTGEKIYSKRLGQSCWATPIGIGDRIYFFGKDGTTIVAKAGRTFEILQKNELMPSATEKGESDIRRRANRDKRVPRDDNAGKAKDESKEEVENDEPRRGRDGLLFAEDVQYGYAIVDGSIVIRTGSQLFCIRDEDAVTNVDVDADKADPSADANVGQGATE